MLLGVLRVVLEWVDEGEGLEVRELEGEGVDGEELVQDFKKEKMTEMTKMTKILTLFCKNQFQITKIKILLSVPIIFVN